MQQFDAPPGGVGRPELQGDAGMPTAEGGDRAGHEVAHRNATRGDADGTAVPVAHFTQVADRSVEGGDAGERCLIEHPPGRGRDDPAGSALDQSQAGLFLEALDVLADRRLGAQQGPRGRAKVPGLVHGDENAQVFQSH